MSGQQCDNEMRGVIFKNDKKGNPKAPDYKGSCQINGVELWQSLWLAKDRNGRTYMQVRYEVKNASSVTPAQSGGAAPAPAPQPGAQFGEGIPF